MEIVGQDKLLKLIDSFDLDSFPRSIIIEGKKGSGKHLITKYIIEKLNLNSLILSDKLDNEFIEEASMKSEPIIYVIDTTNVAFTEKNQNSLLKFIEEPLKNSYIIILSENKSKLLPTIVNRCQLWKLAEYSNEILSGFLDSELDKQLILSIARTPGKLKDIKGEPISEIYSYAIKVIDNMKRAPYANALVNLNKFSLKGETDKYNLDLFIDLMIYELSKRKRNGDNSNDKILRLTNEFKSDLENVNYIDKYYAFMNYLSKYWQIERGRIV